MGHFYALLESGHTTASTGLKRLVGYTGKNYFYRANRELGRIFKTEHILRVMSDPLARRRMRRGLLKNEEMHGPGSPGIVWETRQNNSPRFTRSTKLIVLSLASHHCNL
jgi:hypothetical protein